MSPLLLLPLAVAGGAGAIVRFVVDGLLRDRIGARLPWGTAIINVSGSFLLGLLTGLAAHGLPAAALLVLGTGLLGGYTTFSTASVETVRLIGQRRYAASLAYGLGVLILSVAAGALGLALGSF
ncbi:fluoride efflux transporter FluC [Amnibacterium sp.]|uniref:fluoride efflux transporter FluC n=1 Tax=Amnibacterium sp. TaxID=1872496 RepID=UPI003F7BD3B2